MKKRRVSDWIRRILKVIYPERVVCVNCDKELTGVEEQIGLCKNCLAELYLISGDSKHRRELVTAKEWSFDLGFSAILYQGLIKEMIHRVKYYGERKLIMPLVEVMYRHLPTSLVNIHWDGLIPVPMHPKRLYQRGFNQALLLAEGLGWYLKQPCCDWIVRRRDTIPQNKLKVKERQQNLEGVFELGVSTDQIIGRNWLIIDDILTTGATVNQVSRVLKQAGANLVGVYTLASGSLDVYL